MRVSKILGSLIAVGIAVIAMTTTTDSRAGDEELLDIKCAGGKLTVSAKGNWYVNAAAPWKWDKGEKKSVSGGDHEKRGPDHGKAVFEGAKCEGTVKAYVCNGDQCKGPIPAPVH